MAYRDNVYRPDEQKERDRRRAKEDASIRAAAAKRRARSEKKIITDADIKKKQDAIKKAQSLTPYKKVIRSKKTQEGLIARLKAKQEGKKAAVRIAKARVAKQKKTPITAEAIKKNHLAGIHREKANAFSGFTRQVRNEAKRRTVIDVKELGKPRTARNLTTMSLRRLQAGEWSDLSGWRVSEKERRAASVKEKQFRIESKAAARKSGGLSTAMKRNAEAGIAHIVRGRALKGAARASGVLGIASLFAQHLGGKDKKNG